MAVHGYRSCPALFHRATLTFARGHITIAHVSLSSTRRGRDDIVVIEPIDEDAIRFFEFHARFNKGLDVIALEYKQRIPLHLVYLGSVDTSVCLADARENVFPVPRVF